MADYHFLTTWEFAASPERVWEFVGDPARWPEFWPGLEAVHLVDGPGGGAEGSTYEFVFKSFLPYTVTMKGKIVEVEPARREVMKTKGELEGTGVFTIDVPREGVSRTQLKWDTRTTVAWMNLTAPIFRGLFEWNHDFLMRMAGNGLSEAMGAPVVHKEATGTTIGRALMPFAGIAVAALIARRILRRD